MATATVFKFGAQIEYYIQECKTRSQGSKTTSHGYILNLRTAENESETSKAIVF